MASCAAVTDSIEIIFEARAAYIAGRGLMHDAAVLVRGGLIVDIVPRSATADLSCRRVETELLLPGFINAHCHVEYSHLRGCLPAGVPFPDWLAAMYDAKRHGTDEDFAAGAREGVKQLLAGGTTTVVDSHSRPATAAILAESPLRYVALFEMIGLDDARAEDAMGLLRQRLAAPSAGRCIASGVNPHAPYTVGPALRARLRELLGERPELPCGWHLAESEAEMEMLASGAGPLADFLDSHGLPRAFETAPGCGAVQYLEREGLLASCDAAFHLNFPAEGDAAVFAPPRLIVHCPGTHRFFARPPFPMWKMLSCGANIALGTDSLASGESLSMLKQLRLAASAFSFLSGVQLLDLATRNPARWRPLAALKPPVGIIAPGACADFASLTAGPGVLADLREILVHPATRVAATFIAGEQVA
ncbi:MAG: amidohydrolase family protein [Candidatus Sumerlaeaceae bacterium]|nr:amidohydrolase family protein [Candidatus Sumerlaeaceae bacterium]